MYVERAMAFLSELAYHQSQCLFLCFNTLIQRKGNHRIALTMSSELNELEGQFVADALETLDLMKLRSELLTEYPSQVYDTKIALEILQKHVPADLKPMEDWCARHPDLFRSHLTLSFIQKVTSQILQRSDKEHFECVQRAVWQGISDLSSDYENTPEYGNPASFERLTALRMDLRKAHCHYQCSQVDHMITLELGLLEPDEDQVSIQFTIMMIHCVIANPLNLL